MAIARSFDWVSALYLAHALLELALGGIKLRGRYSAFEMPDGAAKFARHHGVALLSIALLGFLVWKRKLVHTETGALGSMVLAFFHVACVAVMVHAQHAKVVFIHLPFACAFLAHAARTSTWPSVSARDKIKFNKTSKDC
jgi:hypothetical protein